jgi:glycine cleavage system aminomethyltransferase T
MRMRELAIGDVPVRALRVTFVGEVGWELYCPSEYGAGLWRTVWEAGREHGLMAGGYRAIDSLRLEKGYRVWAADITPDETPLEAGLGFCVRDDRSFVGADGLREPDRRLRCLVLEDPRSVALGNEPVRVGDEVCGRVTSGGYGYTVQRSIAYAYLPAEIQIGTEVEVDIFGRWVGGQVAREPLFDPDGDRMRVSV